MKIPVYGLKGARLTPFLIVSLVVSLLFLVQYAFTYVSPALGILLSLGCVLAVYTGASLFDLGPGLSELLEALCLPFIYVLLTSSLPWFFFRQELLIPAVYSIVLGLCLSYVFTKGLSFRAIGLVGRGWRRYLSLGVVFGIPMGVVEYLILLPEPPFPTFNLVYLLQSFFSMTLFMGLGEELLFRGIILTRLEGVFGRYSSLYISAVIFAVMHLSWRLASEIAFVFFAGVVLGGVFQRTRSLAFPIMMHSVSNVVLLTVAHYLFA